MKKLSLAAVAVFAVLALSACATFPQNQSCSGMKCCSGKMDCCNSGKECSCCDGNMKTGGQCQPAK